MTGDNDQLSHVNESGEANMVDIGGKLQSVRVAVACSVVRMMPATLEAIVNNQIKKGEVLAVARVAGIQAAKKCADLIPLCHPLPLDKVTILIEPMDAAKIRITCEARVTHKTGVEMEALTGCSGAALTIYDMCKAIDKGIVIEETCLLEKTGGKSGSWARQENI